MGKALKEMLLYFNWKRLAMFYNDDGAARHCYHVAHGFRKAIHSSNISTVLRIGIHDTVISDEDIERFLNDLPSLVRSELFICNLTQFVQYKYLHQQPVGNIIREKI